MVVRRVVKVEDVWLDVAEREQREAQMRPVTPYIFALARRFANIIANGNSKHSRFYIDSTITIVQ